MKQILHLSKLVNCSYSIKKNVFTCIISSIPIYSNGLIFFHYIRDNYRMSVYRYDSNTQRYIMFLHSFCIMHMRISV